MRSAIWASNLTGVPTQSLAAELRAELARQRLSQRELAKRLGTSQAWVSRRLVGEVEPTPEEISQIAGALGVPASKFRRLANEPV